MTLQQAFLDVSAQLPTSKDVTDRLNRAYDIIRANGSGYAITKYITDAGYKYRVHRASTQLLEDNSITYDVTVQTCTCPDFEKARANLCKHRLAVMMLVAMDGDK